MKLFNSIEMISTLLCRLRLRVLQIMISSPHTFSSIPSWSDDLEVDDSPPIHASNTARIPIKQTSEMTTTMVDLQIIPLHNCTKCIRKVKKTLCRFDGVKLLDVDSENGKFTIETTRHPEEIRDALQHKFAGKFFFSVQKDQPFESILDFGVLLIGMEP